MSKIVPVVRPGEESHASSSFPDDDSAVDGLEGATTTPNRRDRHEKRTRFNLKFDPSAYSDSNGLKKSLFKIIAKNTEDGKKNGGFRAVAGLLTETPLWQPYLPINEKKAASAFHRLMKQIGKEIAVGRLNPSPDQPALPKFLQYGLKLFNTATPKKRLEYLEVDESGAKEKEEEESVDGEEPASLSLSIAPAATAALEIAVAPIVPQAAATAAPKNNKRKAPPADPTPAPLPTLPASEPLTDSTPAPTPQPAKKPRSKKDGEKEKAGAGKLSGYVVGKKLCNDESRDRAAEHLAQTLSLHTIGDLLKASEISAEGLKTFQSKFNLSKPLARALKPIGEALLASAQGGVEVHIKDLSGKLELNEGDTMDIYEFLRCNVI